MNIVKAAISFWLLWAHPLLMGMEKQFQPTELSSGFQGNLTDELLRELQKKTEQLSLLELTDLDVKKNVDASPLKKFFDFGLLDACIQHAAASATMSPFAYQLPYPVSRFVLSDLPICLNQGKDFIELYRLDSMKSTGKLLFSPDYSVLFSPQRRTICIWNATRCVVFAAQNFFAYSYPESEQNEKIDPHTVCITVVLPPHPIVDISYTVEEAISLHHVEKESSHAFVLSQDGDCKPSKAVRSKNGVVSKTSAIDGHYYARISYGNRIEILSSLCRKGNILVQWKAPFPIADIIWPSYDQGVLVAARDGESIVTLTTRVAYLLSRYKKITAAYSSSSFSTKTNS